MKCGPRVVPGLHLYDGVVFVGEQFFLADCVNPAVYGRPVIAEKLVEGDFFHD
jgi:hypothetical protein